MEWKKIFLGQHANTHSRAVSTQGRRKAQDRICEGLSDDELRTCPEGRFNSIAWLIWHMARCEDVAVNAMLCQEEEVLDREGWLPRLGVTTRHIGTGASMAEVVEFSQQVDLAALQAYRTAVGCATRTWVETLSPTALEGCLSAEMVPTVVARGDLGAQALWITELWGGEDWPKVDYLSWLALEHNWLHVGEAHVTLTALGHGLG